MKVSIKRTLIVIAPLIVIVAVLFLIYGPEEPPDAPQVNQVATAIGMVYGIFVFLTVAYWWMSSRKHGVDR